MTTPSPSRTSPPLLAACLLATLMAACSKPAEKNTGHQAAAIPASAFLDPEPVGFAPTTGAVPDRLYATPGGGLGHSISRANPAFSAPEVGRVANGDECQVIERSPDGGWYHVQNRALGGNHQGWIHRDVLSLTPGGLGGGDLRRARRLYAPPGGCLVGGVIYTHQGQVWGCSGGGNWCASAQPLAGGCPR